MTRQRYSDKKLWSFIKNRQEVSFPTGIDLNLYALNYSVTQLCGCTKRCLRYSLLYCRLCQRLISGTLRWWQDKEHDRKKKLGELIYVYQGKRKNLRDISVADGRCSSRQEEQNTTLITLIKSLPKWKIIFRKIMSVKFFLF